eukprot:15434432-Alexandrium_andersonii.AAC.1
MATSSTQATSGESTSLSAAKGVPREPAALNLRLGEKLEAPQPSPDSPSEVGPQKSGRRIAPWASKHRPRA